MMPDGPSPGADPRVDPVLHARRHTPPERSEGRRNRVSCGLRDIIAGMADDTYGFRDGGLARRAGVRFGWHLDGTGEEMDGFSAPDTGGNLRFSIVALVNEGGDCRSTE